MLINLPKMPKDVKFEHHPDGILTKPIYKYEFDPKYGCPRRVQTGEINVRDFIQQSADDVDFKAIGKMLVDTRDNVVSHFTNEQGETMDITGMPRNIHEYEALHRDIHKSFDNLPDDLKALFSDDYNVFAQSYQNGTASGIIANYFTPKSEEKVEDKE